MELFAKKSLPRPPINHAATQRALYRLYLEKLRAVTDYSLLAMRAAATFGAAARLLDELARIKLSHASQLGQLLLRDGISPTPREAPQREWQQMRSFTKESELLQLLTARAGTERSTAENEREQAKEAGADTALPLAKLLTAIADEDEAHAEVIDGLLLRMQRS